MRKRSLMFHLPVNTDMKQSVVRFESIVPSRRNWPNRSSILARWDRFDAFATRPTCVRKSRSSTADVVPVFVVQGNDRSSGRVLPASGSHRPANRQVRASGTYDFVITKDYCRNNTPPKALAVLFVIDVSYNNVKSGLPMFMPTSCSDKRQLRVPNLSLKTCNQLADLFRSCDLDTTNLLFAKPGLFKLLENNPKAIKDSLITRTAQILACYRKNCASSTSADQLVLPNCMKLLPLYISCLLRTTSFRGCKDLTLDDRSYVIYFLTSVRYFYPRLTPVQDANAGASNVAAAIRCTADKMMKKN
ncbi:hypothetical protein pipiens_018875 [Culex pipiens pipiens]|uniref:Sec23/Sec24 helical domain-containing protein n=1 Tax=Culex pipiens pipiens TaxID=38569 RepID=A0ABD1DXS5_CULPP